MKKTYFWALGSGPSKRADGEEVDVRVRVKDFTLAEAADSWVREFAYTNPGELDRYAATECFLAGAAFQRERDADGLDKLAELQRQQRSMHEFVVLNNAAKAIRGQGDR